MAYPIAVRVSMHPKGIGSTSTETEHVPQRAADLLTSSIESVCCITYLPAQGKHHTEIFHSPALDMEAPP